MLREFRGFNGKIQCILNKPDSLLKQRRDSCGVQFELSGRGPSRDLMLKKIRRHLRGHQYSATGKHADTMALPPFTILRDDGNIPMPRLPRLIVQKVFNKVQLPTKMRCAYNVGAVDSDQPCHIEFIFKTPKDKTTTNKTESTAMLHFRQHRAKGDNLQIGFIETKPYSLHTVVPPVPAFKPSHGFVSHSRSANSSQLLLPSQSGSRRARGMISNVHRTPSLYVSMTHTYACRKMKLIINTIVINCVRKNLHHQIRNGVTFARSTSPMPWELYSRLLTA